MMSDLDTMLREGRLERLTIDDKGLTVKEKTKQVPHYEVTFQVIDKKAKAQKKSAIVKEIKAVVPPDGLGTVWEQILHTIKGLPTNPVKPIGEE